MPAGSGWDGEKDRSGKVIKGIVYQAKEGRPWRNRLHVKAMSQMLSISVSLAGPKHLISLAWPLISSSYSYIELHNIFNQVHWKSTQNVCFRWQGRI